MLNPKLSIIIPVYNTESYIGSCVESILCQNLSDIEIVLVDDGSNDSSGVICDNLARSDNRIKVFHKPNAGVSSARNIGIREARGEWIMFVDSDDSLKLNSLQFILNKIDSDVGLVVAGYEVVEVNGKVASSAGTGRFDGAEVKLDKVRSAIKLYEDECYQFYCVAKLYRRDVMRDNGIAFNESIYYNEDKLFVVDYLCSLDNKYKVVFVPHPIYIYALRLDGAMIGALNLFNEKTLTAFYAELDASDMLMQTFNDPIIIKLAKIRCVGSYLTVITKARQANRYENRLNKRLLTRLFQSISKMDFIHIIIRKLIRSIINKCMIWKS